MFIPESVEKNYNLSPNEKFLYGLILQSSDSTGICTETNSFFAANLGGNFGVSERTIRNYLKKLKDEALITVASFGKIKNAIFVVNREHLNELTAQKNKSITLDGKLEHILEKFFQQVENKGKETTSDNPILSLIYDLFNLVLVSKENKNILNNSAGARVDSVNKNLNRFANYQEAGKPERVKKFDFESRKPYMQILFKDFFEFWKGSTFYEDGKVVIDTMLEAYEQSKTQRGFVFNLKTYRPADLIDLYFNITPQEFKSIVNNVHFAEIEKSKSCYIMGAIIQAGSAVTWKKTMELVSAGYPWDSYVPGQKPLQDIVFGVQNLVKREQQTRAVAKEFAAILPSALGDKYR